MMRLFQKYTARLPRCDQEVEVAPEIGGYLVRLPAPPATVHSAAAGAAAADAVASARADEKLLTWEETECGRVLVRIGGQPVECRITRLADGAYRIEWLGRQVLVRVTDDLAERARLAHASHGGPLPLRSPMPGTVVKILVQDGDLVALEQPLLVIEAMKMQNELAAPVAGEIQNLAVRPGQAVEGDQVLLEIRM